VKRWIFCLMLLFSFSAGTATSASTWNSYLLNRKALNSLKKENFSEGLHDLLAALESDPLNPRLHLNLGMTLFALGEPDKAAKAFLAAGKLATSAEEKYVALFDEAYSLGESKQIDKALQTYQQALAIKPDAEEVKVNIELLLASQGKQGKGEGEGKPDQDGKQSSQNNQGQGDRNQDDKKNNQGQGDQQKQKPKRKSRVRLRARI